MQKLNSPVPSCIELDRETAIKSIMRNLEHARTVFKYESQWGIIPALFLATDELAATEAYERGASAEDYLDLIINPLSDRLKERGLEPLCRSDVLAFNSHGCRPIQTFTTQSIAIDGEFSTLDYFERFLSSYREVFVDAVMAVDLLEPTLKLSREHANEIADFREMYLMDNGDDIKPQQIYNTLQKSDPKQFAPLGVHLAFTGEEEDTKRWIHFFNDQGFELEDWDVMRLTLLDEISETGNNQRQVMTWRVVNSPVVQAFTEANVNERDRKLVLDKVLQKINKVISAFKPESNFSADVPSLGVKNARLG